MSKLFIPVGIPGCGKTTYRHTIDHPNLYPISTDDIRIELTGDVNDQTNNTNVFDLYHRRINDHLMGGDDVFADATNLRDYAREHLRNIALQTAAETHVLVFTNLTQAVKRNNERERVVPPEAMIRMLEQYERALRDLPEEVYTTVTYIEAVS